MRHSKPPYPLDPKRALICMLILTSPFAVAETKQNVDGKKSRCRQIQSSNGRYDGNGKNKAYCQGGV